jgi:hypothetical protein
VSPDGPFLASGGDDGTILLWDVTAPLRNRPSKEKQPSPKDLDRLWSELASVDAVEAYEAMCELLACPEETVPDFRKRLQPVAPADARRIARLIKDLNDDRFETRHSAFRELEEMNDLAQSALEQALTQPPSPEAARRLELLVERLREEAENPSAERRRRLRALEVLERLHTREAEDLLVSLSRGAAGAWLTREAKATLQRQRQQPNPD